MKARYVVFSHGLESGPWGTKISTLASTASAEGYEVESVDYRGIADPRARVTKLVDFCKDLTGDLILCGSSLGGYVSIAASAHLHATGVFLLAPALTMPELPPLRPRVLDCPASIVHGWHDAVVPVAHSIAFARDYRCALHLLHTDHRMHDQLRAINYLFEYFIVGLDLPVPPYVKKQAAADAGR